MRIFIYSILVAVGLVVAVVSWFIFSEPPAVTDFKAQISQAKGTVKSVELKNAVLALLTNTNVSITESNIPSAIISFPMFSDLGKFTNLIHVIPMGDNDRQGIFYMAGSGFGHRGVLVAPYPNGAELTNGMHAWIFPWENGIYFCLEK